MKTTEKDIVIQKVLELSPEQVEKIMIFIAGLEAGCNTGLPLQTQEWIISNKENAIIKD